MNATPSLLRTLQQSPAAWLIALLLGASVPFGFAPYHAWPVMLLAIAGFTALLHDTRPGRAAQLSFAFGMGLWLHGVNWLIVSMHTYGNTALPIAILLLVLVAVLMSLLMVPLGWAYARFRLWQWSLVSLPALWLLMEWSRTWAYTGFPWLMAGYGFIDTPLAGWAPIFGIYGVSTAAVLTGVALTDIWRRGKQAAVAIASLAVLWIGGALLNPISWTSVDTQAPFTVSLVQGNIPQESKWALEWRDKTTAIYEALSASEWGRDAIIWPEAAIPQFAHEAPELFQRLDEHGRRHKTAMVTGVPFATWNADQTEVLYFNSAVAVGDADGEYHKQKLVMVGEYIPFERWLRDTLPLFNLPFTSFQAGDASQAPLRIKQHSLSPYICFEIAFPSLVQQQSRTDFLLTISNDGWFGRSSGPAQHAQMVHMRAKETGRYIARATNNGQTFVVGPDGQRREQMASFERGVLRATLYPAHGLTPWQRFGATPLLLLALLALVLCVWRAQQARQ